MLFLIDYATEGPAPAGAKAHVPCRPGAAIVRAAVQRRAGCQAGSRHVLHRDSRLRERAARGGAPSSARRCAGTRAVARLSLPALRGL